MRRTSILLSATVCLFVASAALGHPPSGSRTTRYPRVYGATGHLYGPTQAHYQYQRQYGRPWHGYRGLSANYGHHHQHSFGYGYSPFSYQRYGYSAYSPYVGFYGRAAGPVYSYIPMAPIVIQGHPQFIGSNPFNNSVLKKALKENDERWGKQLIVKPQIKTVERPIRESTPAAKLKSLRAQSQGDHWFKKGNYLQAYSRYKTAVSHADDRADAHFRLGYVLVAIGRCERGVEELKRGLKIDPAWPVTGESLSQIFGAENPLAKSTMVSKVTAWVSEDIRDPDRLFLIGVLLHFSDDDRAAKFFETAIRLTGGGDHLIAFLKKAKPPAEVPPAEVTPQKQPPLPTLPPKPDTKQPDGTAGPSLPPLPAP